MRFQDVPGATISPHGCVSITAVDKKHPDSKQAHQLPAYISIHDFLQVSFGKAARSTSLLLSKNRVIAKSKTREYDLTIS